MTRRYDIIGALVIISMLSFACSSEDSAGAAASSATPACTGSSCTPDPGPGPGPGPSVNCGDQVCSNNEICVANSRCVVPVPAGGSCDDSKPCATNYSCNPESNTCMIAAGLNENCADADKYCRVGTCSDGYCRVISETDALMTTDSNGDTISDYYEIGIKDGFTKDNPRDSDGDTVPDYLSIDANGDGIPNALKAGNKGDMTRKPIDSDGDGVPDYLDSDSDDNGINDADEFSGLYDQNGHKYDVNIETDDASHTQSMTITDENGNVVGTAIGWNGQVYDASGNPVNGLILSAADLDGDTIPDFLDSDIDGDGLSDSIEISGSRISGHAGRKCSGDEADENGWCKYGTSDNPWDSDNDTIPDYLDMDSDNDTIPDAIEGVNDSNNDEVLDRYQLDSDGDTVPDKDEVIKDANGYYVLIGADGYSDVKDSEGRKLVETSDGKLIVTNETGSPVACGTNKFLAVDRNSGAYVLSTDGGNADLQFLYNADCSPRTDADGHNLALDAEGNIYAVDAATNEVIKDDSGNPVVNGKMPNTPVHAFHTPLYTCDDEACNYKNICYQSPDCDRDGLSDGKEVWCDGVWSGAVANADGDAYLDAAEWAAADFAIRNHKQAHVDTEVPWVGTCTKTESTLHAINTPADLICNPSLGVENIFDFYFELLPDDAQKNSTLVFRPEVSKLDVVFNMDTTGSMGGEVLNLRNRISSYIIPRIRAFVGNSGFGVTRFDDFPAVKEEGGWFSSTSYYGRSYSSGDVSKGYCSASGIDKPYELLGTISTVDATVEANVNKLCLHNGGDNDESGYQALWQILMGDDRSYTLTSWKGDNAGSMSYHTPAPGTWGGVDFREGTLPVVVHITDVTAHDPTSNSTYNGNVVHPYYSSDVHTAYANKGARIISIYRSGGEQLSQLVNTSNATRAIVPACTFKKSDSSWMCGANRCCTTTSSNGVAPDANGNCVLSYGISDANTMSDTLVSGIDALVKYGTYDVSTVVHKDDTDNRVDTTCFIKKVVASEYVPPCQEPEASCNPPAIAAKVNAADYNDGFKNFAPGTSSQDRPGAQLKFEVYAQNHNDATGKPCVEQTDSVQQFNAYNDVVNPVTGLVFGTRQVSIIVPGKVEHTSVN